MSEVLFYLLAASTVAAAIGVILNRNPVYSALSLVVTLFLMAVCFLALGAHLVAALQIIIYAGAVMVLFLFVIMLLHTEHGGGSREPLAGWIAACTAALALIGILAPLLWHSAQSPITGGRLGEGFGTTVELARLLFTEHLVAFELTSVLLLVAVVGATVLARGETLAGDEEEQR